MVFPPPPLCHLLSSRFHRFPVFLLILPLRFLGFIRKKIPCRRAAKRPPCSPIPDARRVDAQAIQRLLLAPTPTWSQLQQSNLDSQCPAYIGGSTGMHRLQDISTAAGLVSRDRVAPACALAAVAIILLRSSMAAAMEDDVAGLT